MLPPSPLPPFPPCHKNKKLADVTCEQPLIGSVECGVNALLLAKSLAAGAKARFCSMPFILERIMMTYCISQLHTPLTLLQEKVDPNVIQHL